MARFSVWPSLVSNFAYALVVANYIGADSIGTLVSADVALINVNTFLVSLKRVWLESIVASTGP